MNGFGGGGEQEGDGPRNVWPGRGPQGIDPPQRERLYKPARGRSTGGRGCQPGPSHMWAHVPHPADQRVPGASAGLLRLRGRAPSLLPLTLFPRLLPGSRIRSIPGKKRLIFERGRWREELRWFRYDLHYNQTVSFSFFFFLFS